MISQRLVIEAIRSSLMLIALLLGVICNESAAQNAPLRIWTDSDGRQIRAQIEGFENEGTVLFKLENGKTARYPIARLSEADMALAKEAYATRPANSEIDWDKPKQSKDYVIKGVRRQNAPGYVFAKSGWVWEAKCIEVKIEYKGEKEPGKGDVKAYFYNRDGKLLEKVNAPPRQQDKDRVYVNPLTSFARGKTVEAYFPLTEFLETSGWSTVLIAFGSGDDYAVGTLPQRSLKDLDFDEKKHLFPDWKPEASKGKDAGSTTNAAPVNLEIRQVRQKEYADALLFDGKYREGMPCVSLEVRATGGIIPGDAKVKLYVYNADGSLVGSKAEPSSAQIGGTDSYVGIPRIADERWHPVYFALDKGIGKDHPTYLCVFQFQGKVVAEVSSSKATVDSLDFPEKSRLDGAK